MNDERRRILRMLAEGTISVDEGEELLHALSDRRTEKVEREIKAAQGKRPVWPYVLLIALAIVALPMWGIGMGILKDALHRFAGPFGILFVIFWVWMLVDCIRRRPEDFRLLFTAKHEHEKWIWCAIVLLAGWVGSLVYFIVIRQPARSIVPPAAPKVQDRRPEAPLKSVEPEEPFTPSPRARSLTLFVLAGVLAAVVATSLFLMYSFPPWRGFPHEFLGWHWQPTRLRASTIAPALRVILGVFAVWMLVFWFWMLFDCLARDHRDFGEKRFTGDRSLDKILWLLLILFTFVIGALAYHILVRRRPRPTPSSVGE